MSGAIPRWILGIVLFEDGRHPFLPWFDHPLLRSFLHRAIIKLAICLLVLAVGMPP
jgi:hypothetical protein